MRGRGETWRHSGPPPRCPPSIPDMRANTACCAAPLSGLASRRRGAPTPGCSQPEDAATGAAAAAARPQRWHASSSIAARRPAASIRCAWLSSGGWAPSRRPSSSPPYISCGQTDGRAGGNGLLHNGKEAIFHSGFSCCQDAQIRHTAVPHPPPAPLPTPLTLRNRNAA